MTHAAISFERFSEYEFPEKLTHYQLIALLDSLGRRTDIHADIWGDAEWGYRVRLRQRVTAAFITHQRSLNGL